MVSKFLLVSILDLLLGLNFLSPAVLIRNSLGTDEAVYADSRPQITPYLFPAAETNYFPIRDWGVPDPSLSARSALLYDFASDKILFSSNPETKLPIASLTKLLTAVIVLENMDLNDTVEVKKTAIEKSRKEGGGSNLYAGERIKASDLLKLMLIESSNDAAYAFEEHLSENYGIKLVEKMNEGAKNLSMNNTYFTEAAGLDDKNSFSTARDLVELVKYSFKYENLYDILKTREAEVVSIDGNLKHQIFNTNQLLGKLLNVIGGKTGFTELAGGSMILVTEAPNSSSRLVTVILGSEDRFSDVERMIEWVKSAYIWR
ncbi:MAG: D-alanyl-D-alanine carboxypeptidase [Parcubacteria group bacterium]|nr:D-alanyl-D-alanine carboxypeptidase [Parcubacteria group bacterium]